jgi:DNA transposition AAA+ family ATPase
MPAKWTADLLGEMHLAGVTAKQLAAEVGWNPKYLSVVLNGHKEPKGAEEKLNAALARLTSGECDQDSKEPVQ